MKRRVFMIAMVYVIGITIIGICDTLNGGVEKRAKAQEIRSEKLEKNQAELQAQVERRQQKMEEDMKRRQVNP